MEPRVLLYDSAGEGEPLVLLPGGLTGWVSWIPHQDRLSEHRRVIRVQPIHNELGSAGHVGNPEYTGEIERESLRMTLDELGLGIADFAGWSGGGNALLQFTLAYPERVRSITLIEPASQWILDELGVEDPRLESMNALTRHMAGREITEDLLAEFLGNAAMVDDPAEARSHPYWEKALPHKQTLSWLSPELFATDATLDDVRAIDCPALLVKGTVTEPWEKTMVDALGEYLPNARVLELDGGHASHIESIDRFVAELEAHLSRV